MSGKPAKARRRAARAAQVRDRGVRRRDSRVASAPAPTPAITPLGRADAVWSAATAGAAAVIFATTLSGHPGLGDAPETVSGVGSVGVLHAPGYPAYVLAAKAFTLLEPFGSLAFRVNLFSLLCASLTTAGVFLLARRLGAVRWAAALGALGLATAAGFWFYATFAKHFMFSGLVFLVALHLVLHWRERPTTGRLAAVAAAVAVGLGSSWPLMVLLVPAIAYVIFCARPQTSLRSVGSAGAVGLVVVVALYGFVMVRADQQPAVNWGEASNLPALVSLITRADYEDSESDEAGERQGALSDPPAGSPNRASVLPISLEAYGLVFWRELGIAALALAAWGLVVSLRGNRGAVARPLLIVFVANLLGAALAVGAGRASGYEVNLIQAGFLLGCSFALACWLALGAGDVVARTTRSRWSITSEARRKLIERAAVTVLAIAVLAPSLILHWPVANRSSEPFADRYAESVFRELPPRAVLFVWGAEKTQPLIYRQEVHGERRDVVVVAADGLSFGWYRRQLARRLDRRVPPLVRRSVEDARSVVESLRGVRPVFLDAVAARTLKDVVGYRQQGLLARLAEARGAAPVESPALVDRRLREAQRIAGIPDAVWRVRPNSHVASSYATAALEVARGYFRQRDREGMRRALLNVLSIDPKDKTARRNLKLLSAGYPLGG